MKQAIRQIATLFTFCLTLQATLPLIVAQAPPQNDSKAQKPSATKKPPTEQQTRDRVFALLRTEMKNTGKLSDGWQEAYRTPKGAIYAYIQRGQVKNIGVSTAKSDSKMAVEALRLYAPSGFGNVRDIGDTVVLQPNDEPTDEQRAKCKKKLAKCFLGNFFSSGPLKIAAAVASGSWAAVGLAVLDEAEKTDQSIEMCIGETCRRILNIN